MPFPQMHTQVDLVDQNPSTGQPEHRPHVAVGYGLRGVRQLEANVVATDHGRPLDASAKPIPASTLQARLTRALQRVTFFETFR
jgi:hypothetical protein